MMEQEVLYRRWLWTIVLIALTIRIVAACVWQYQLHLTETDFRFGDSQSYWVIAKNLATGNGYQYGSENARVFRAPLYPITLLPWVALSQVIPMWLAVSLARIMGCALGAAAVAGIMAMGRAAFGTRAACIAGGLACIYPGAVAMSIFVLSEAVATPCMILSCYWFLVGVRNDQRRNRAFLAAGIALGLACLARPSWSLWPLVAGPYWLLVVGWLATVCLPTRAPVLAHAPVFDHAAKLNHAPIRWPNSLRCIFLFAIGIMLAMTPWWIRNYAVTGKWVPSTLQVGASLYDGWHPGASGSSDENMDFVLPFLVAQQEEDRLLAQQGISLESTFEWRVDRRMRMAATDWAWKNPSDVARLGLVKLVKTWSPVPSAREIQPWIRWSEGLGYIVIGLWAIAGSIVYRKERGAWFVWMPCLYLAILHAVFIGSIRYRQPGVMLLCPLAGAGCLALLEWIFKRDPTRTNGPFGHA